MKTSEGYTKFLNRTRFTSLYLLYAWEVGNMNKDCYKKTIEIHYHLNKVIVNMDTLNNKFKKIL